MQLLATYTSIYRSIPWACWTAKLGSRKRTRMIGEWTKGIWRRIAETARQKSYWVNSISNDFKCMYVIVCVQAGLWPARDWYLGRETSSRKQGGSTLSSFKNTHQATSRISALGYAASTSTGPDGGDCFKFGEQSAVIERSTLWSLPFGQSGQSG